ncbi:MAG: Glu-tRNA(Gln) amidotransferase subunit GatD [Candidatus Aenigmarchaeota archaeon]|nr:Glu-tRNA(Gln) amidotransferase subunit GatD [Candidatus Aenigmarchaeota archaeon]
MKSKKLKIGDRVKVLKDGKEFQGFLMPRIEIGDLNSLVIKLDNGYNIGLKYEKRLKIQKMGQGIKLGSIPSKKFSRKPGLPSVSLIATGGTIGTHVDYKTGGVFMVRTPEEIVATTPELENIVNMKTMLRPFTVASEDMNHKHWQELAELVAKELNKGARGVMVTHGTDTLHFTSAALSFMLKNLTKPVALVGAQRSPDRGSFDGVMNLICGSYFTGYSNIGEVCVVMHGTTNDDFCFAHRGTKVRKMHTSRRDAFRSINEIPLAKIWPNGKIEIGNENYRRFDEKKVVADTKFEPKVALVKSYPGSDPEILDWYVHKGFKGIVIEGSGLGHVPTGESGVKIGEFDQKFSWIPQIKKAVENGVVVVMTSQTLYGRVHPFVYRNLRLVYEAGGIYGEDMLPEVAYIKLGHVLGHTKDVEKAKQMMLMNLAGEINKETDPRSFLV